MKKCSLQGCIEKHYAKGFCNKHYSNFKRTGNPIPKIKHDRHGMRNTKEYECWANMISRCTNKNKKQYKNYGGRGIKVCDRWMKSFINFYNDMGDCNGLTLDRIDVNGDYEPNNCRWVNMVVQARNRRTRKDSSSGVTGVRWHKASNKWASLITFNGKEKHLGVFKNKSDAIKARKEAEIKYWN